MCIPLSPIASAESTVAVSVPNLDSAISLTAYPIAATKVIPNHCPTRARRKIFAATANPRSL